MCRWCTNINISSFEQPFLCPWYTSKGKVCRRKVKIYIETLWSLTVRYQDVLLIFYSLTFSVRESSTTSVCGSFAEVLSQGALDFPNPIPTLFLPLDFTFATGIVQNVILCKWQALYALWPPHITHCMIQFSVQIEMPTPHHNSFSCSHPSLVHSAVLTSKISSSCKSKP